MEKAVIFGAGMTLDWHFENIEHNFQIVAIVDNDKRKQGTNYCGYVVSSPNILFDVDFDAVLIVANDKNSLEIKYQLQRMGFENKVRLFGENGITPFTINPLFFATNLTSEDRQQLFSENVERIVLELSSKCNRKCWFCTNSLLSDEKSENIDMEEGLFDKILRELKEIDYDRDICLSLYNEPLLSDKIIDRVKEIKRVLPKSFVYIFSNGDYLNADLLASLEEAGLDLLYIDIYISEIKYDVEVAYSVAEKLIDKLEISISLQKKEHFLRGSTFIGNMEIEIVSNDFSIMASNRAESIPSDRLIPKITSHPKACIKNFMGLHIDYRGDVWPCPNYHRDYQQHRQYCVGNLRNESIFDVYIGEKLTKFREMNFFHRDELPCRSCIMTPNFLILNRFSKPFHDRKYIENDHIYTK